MNVKLSDKHKIKVKDSDDIFEVMRHILLRDNKIDREKEHFWLICLANNNLIINIELVSLGSVDSTIIKPMNVFRVAVLKGAVRVMLCHNHPSGEMRPSEADKDVTDRLIQVGRILNIKVIDHLIISTNTYMSFSDTGLMEKLEKSTTWVPKFELVEQIRAEEKALREQALAIEKEKALKKIETIKQKAEADRIKAVQKVEADKNKLEIKAEREKRELLKQAENERLKANQAEIEKEMAVGTIAKGMKEKNIPIETIIEITGLSKKEIEAL